MKRIVLILVSVMLTVTILTSCNNSVVEPPSEMPTEPTVQEMPESTIQEIPQSYEPTPITFEPTEDWEIALVEYLAQFPPMFHNVRFRDESWASWWESDWHDFVEELVEYWSDEWWELENLSYGYTFVFRDPLTGERVEIDDVPYLNQLFSVWYDDNDVQGTWTGAEIATHFDLLDLDGSGISALVIYWSISPQNMKPGVAVTLHRFRNGAYESVTTLSNGLDVAFYRADDGMLFIEYISTVAHMIDLFLLHLDDVVTIEPVLSTDGWTGTVQNHLTGEYFEQDEFWGRYREFEWEWEEYLAALLGQPLTRIGRMEVQEQLTEFIAVQLRANGRIR